MNKITPVVNNLFWVDEEGESHSVPVAYRERSAEEVPTTDNLPSVIVQPVGEGYAVVVMTETVEQQNQVSEQVIGQFNYEEHKNQKGDLRLDDVRRTTHGAAYATEFKISKLV